VSIIACSADECERGVTARGLCTKHYKAATRRGSLDAHAKQPAAAPRGCSIEGCELGFLARTWCATHYTRWRKTGTTDDPPKFMAPDCKLEGCKNTSDSKRGWCAAHYSRWRKSGDPGPAHLKLVKKPIVDGARECSECHAWFPLDGFNAGSHPGTLSNMCRKCQRLYNAAYREANPTYWQQWQKDNIQKTRDISNRRRAHKLSREHEKIDRDLVFERDNFECKLCMKPLDMSAKFPHPWSPTLDHIQPLSKGGHHLYVNLQAAHFRCNTAKGDRVA